MGLYMCIMCEFTIDVYYMCACVYRCVVCVCVLCMRLKMSPGWVWLWFAIWLLGRFLIDVGLEIEPLNGVQHPWLDDLGVGLQLIGGRLRNLAVRALRVA